MLALLACVALGACAGEDPIFRDTGVTDYQAPDGLTCLPNGDGVISLDELAFKAGVKASYRVNPAGSQVGVNIAGEMVSGTLEWDFSSRSGNVFEAKLSPIDGTWYAQHFPDADFAVEAGASSDTLQLLRIEGDSLQLLGLASKQPDRTLMIYDKPLALLRFPLEVGAKYVTTGSVTNGKLDGLPIATDDTYSVHIDASGTVRLPFVKLHKALRVRLDVTSRAVGGATATSRQVQWFAECYGEVVRAVSKRDEPAADFAQAVELRRLTF
ncbi:MAG: hypothetical protein KC503_36775 [Myxococcales bacterium]|nr:hypothetical protein [Myxococcales bacterium]